MVAVIAFFSCYHNFTQGCKGLWYCQMLPVKSHCELKTPVQVTKVFPCGQSPRGCMKIQWDGFFFLWFPRKMCVCFFFLSSWWRTSFLPRRFLHNWTAFSEQPPNVPCTLTHHLPRNICWGCLDGDAPAWPQHPPWRMLVMVLQSYPPAWSRRSMSKQLVWLRPLTAALQNDPRLEGDCSPWTENGTCSGDLYGEPVVTAAVSLASLYPVIRDQCCLLNQRNICKPEGEGRGNKKRRLGIDTGSCRAAQVDAPCPWWWKQSHVVRRAGKEQPAVPLHAKWVAVQRAIL